MSPLWRFGMPPDAAAWAALVLAVLVFVAWRRASRQVLARPWLVVLGLACAASIISCLYVHFYLRGGPRIIDATSYFLQARAMAQGLFSFEPLLPTAAFRGRFLIGPVGDTSLSVIFPPGYPLLLSVGFLLGKPMVVGPLLAFALVLVTYQLALRLFECREIALGAAAFSTICGTLRYHTADTMSHAWAALLFACCMLALTYPRHLAALLAGLAAGWLIATRPVTGALCTLLALYILRANLKILSFGFALLPGLLLLAAHQRAATGSWFTSSQLHYYLASDGPVGCFKYGFGSSVGCLHEHGDVVKRYLEAGFGLPEALLTSLHRLHWHSLDVANFEPLWLVLPFAIFVGRRLPQVRLLSLAILGIIFAYAPFYFNGSYPGGGSRFLADVLPFEHTLLAWGLSRLGGFRVGLPLALIGFSVHASYSHRELAARDGGSPMFSEAKLQEHGIDRGLILINTDHGFNLAFDPAARDAQTGIVSARDQGDARDRVLWELLGRPKLYRYRYTPWAADAPHSITPVTVSTSPVLLFEAENDWPPLMVSGGYAYPLHVGHACASRRKALTLVPNHGQALELQLETMTLEAGRYRLSLGWVKPSDVGRTEYRVKIGPRAWEVKTKYAESVCATSEVGDIALEPGRQAVLLSVKKRALLDFVQLARVPVTP